MGKSNWNKIQKGPSKKMLFIDVYEWMVDSYGLLK